MISKKDRTLTLSLSSNTRFDPCSVVYAVILQLDYGLNVLHKCSLRSSGKTKGKKGGGKDKSKNVKSHTEQFPEVSMI